MSNLTTMKYIGNVDVTIKIGDKLVHLKNHNAGTSALSRTFAKVMTGNTITIEDIPEYIDLRQSSDDGATWKSILSARIALSGKVFEYSSTYLNYIAKLTGVIAYTYLTKTIARDDDTYTYRLYLYSSSLSSGSGYTDLAYLEVDSDTLANLGPGTQAIIEWSMQLVNG